MEKNFRFQGHCIETNWPRADVDQRFSVTQRLCFATWSATKTPPQETNLNQELYRSWKVHFSRQYAPK